MDTSLHRKARGAYFTPTRVAQYVTNWAVRNPSDRILEPSCGDAAFLVPAARRLKELGAKDGAGGQLFGAEIHAPSAQEAFARVALEGIRPTLHVGDFFDWRLSDEHRHFDAVIGNPPYVRYQQFDGEARAKSLRASLAQGVRLSGLASSWAAFTVHAASFLKPEGRLGLVLPAELLSVKYAAEVRRYLLRRFASVRLVTFEELVFPGVLEDVVLLLAEGTGGAPHFEVYQARNADDMDRTCANAWVGFQPQTTGHKWTPALLPADALNSYEEVTDSGGFSLLSDWGETYLGAVTGNNPFFTLSASTARDLGLTCEELLRISPPGSKHLRGLTFERRAWESLVNEDKRCFLFAPSEVPSPAALRYIEKGEANGVHLGYKCRNRKPWWKVPLVANPDLFFTYMNHERPRLVSNGARTEMLNSLYGVTLADRCRALGRDLLPIASLNTVTLLGAEVVGRSYGGGMLKHEPREADLLPVPSLETVKAVAKELRLIRPQVGGALRSGNLARACQLVDQVILEEHLRLPVSDIAALRNARDLLFQRRALRGRSESVSTGGCN